MRWLLLALVACGGPEPLRIDGAYRYEAGPLSGILTVYESADADPKGRVIIAARWTHDGLARDARGILLGQHLTLTLDNGDPRTQTYTVEAWATPGRLDGEITGNGLAEVPFTATGIYARVGKATP